MQCDVGMVFLGRRERVSLDEVRFCACVCPPCDDLNPSWVSHMRVCLAQRLCDAVLHHNSQSPELNELVERSLSSCMHLIISNGIVRYHTIIAYDIML